MASADRCIYRALPARGESHQITNICTTREWFVTGAVMGRETIFFKHFRGGRGMLATPQLGDTVTSAHDSP